MSPAKHGNTYRSLCPLSIHLWNDCIFPGFLWRCTVLFKYILSSRHCSWTEICIAQYNVYIDITWYKMFYEFPQHRLALKFFFVAWHFSHFNESFLKNTISLKMIKLYLNTLLPKIQVTDIEFPILNLQWTLLHSWIHSTFLNPVLQAENIMLVFLRNITKSERKKSQHRLHHSTKPFKDFSC